VPTYLIFRFFRAYVALETLLTLQVRTAQDERRAAVGDRLFKGMEEVATVPVAASRRASG
jgi:hypothetical protein